MAVSPSYEERSRVVALTMASSSRGTSGVSASRPSLTACAGTSDTILAALLRRAGRRTRFEFALFLRRLFDLCFAAINRKGVSERGRSEEHTSELQSRLHLVCRLLL